MPIRYTVDPLQRLVLADCSGALTLLDLRETAVRVAREPFFQPTFSLLFDLTGVTDFQVDAAGLGEYLRSGVDPSSNAARRAFVVSSREAYGLARLFQSFAGGLNVAIFPSRAEAFAWLGRPVIDRQ